MTQPVDLPDDIMAAVRKESELQNRSVTDQIVHWLILGRTAEQSKPLDFHRINLALEGGLSPDKLTPEEQTVWFNRFAVKMVEPCRQEQLGI